MAFENKTLNCRDCSAPFVFTAGEQGFYLEKGLLNSFFGKKHAPAPLVPAPTPVAPPVAPPATPAESAPDTTQH